MNYQSEDFERQGMMLQANMREARPVPGNFQQQPAFNMQVHPQMQFPQSTQLDYAIIRSKLGVDTWSYYIMIIGWSLIVYSILSVFGSLIYLSIGVMALPKVTPEGGIEYVYIEDGGLDTTFILQLVFTVMQCGLGLKCLKTSKNPTRRATWKLVKYAIVLIISYYVIQTLSSVILYDVRFGKMVESISDVTQLDEEFEEKYLYLVFFTFYSLCCSFCCCALCSACLLSCLYKLHSHAKELDITTNLPKVQYAAGMQVSPSIAVNQNQLIGRR